MARSLNSQCDFKMGFYMQLTRRHCTYDFKSQNKTGNHMCIEDTEKQTEKFCPWKKQAKDGKQVP